MFDDITKEIKAQLYDRARSPLFSSFVFSFVAWNLKAIVVLFSDLPFIDKQGYWWEIYETPMCIFNNAFAFPLLSALVFILIFPPASRVVYWYWATQQAALKKVQQSIEDKTPMTLEEAVSLRKTSLEESLKAEARIKELVDRSRELSARIDELGARTLKVEEERDQFKERALVLDAELNEAKNAALGGAPVIDKAPDPHADSAGEQTAYERLVGRVPRPVRDQLNEVHGLNEARSLALLLGLVACGGRARMSDLLASTSMNRIDADVAVAALTKAKVIESQLSSGVTYYVLTGGGRQLVVANDLTRYVTKR